LTEVRKKAVYIWR